MEVEKLNSDEKIKTFIPMWKEYMGMYWFIRNSGLYDEFLDFYKDFTLEKIDDYKQKLRTKKVIE